MEGIFSLEEFAEVYVSKALDLVDRGRIPLEKFDDSLREYMAHRFGTTERSIILMHHPFHWTFFSHKNSPFDLVQAEKDGEQTMVRLNDYFLGEEKIVSELFDNYGSVLEGKYRKIFNPNTYPQQAS